jgi:hypothetical protein
MRKKIIFITVFIGSFLFIGAYVFLKSSFAPMINTGHITAATNKNGPVAGNDSFYISPDKIQFLEREAMNGSAEAAFQLSNHYFMVELNNDAGLIWLRKAAEMGHIIAAYNMYVHLTNFVNKPDVASKVEAMKWLEKAAFANYPSAKYELEKIHGLDKNWPNVP